MTTLTAELAHLEPLLTDRDIEERVDHMIGLADRRQLWWLLLDGRCRQLPVVVPIDDLPLNPDRAFADELAAHSAELLEMTNAAHLIAVWERPGRGRLDPPDAAWARAIADNCRRRGISLRAQVLSHSRGVMVLSPTDYAGSPAGRPVTDAARPPGAPHSEGAQPRPSSPADRVGVPDAPGDDPDDPDNDLDAA